jgi:hypothetical protein
MAARVGPDSREHPRARARIRVEYQFGTTTGIGYTTNISEGGMFLSCGDAAHPSYPPVGARIYLRVHLPGSRAGDALKIIGSVTRAERPDGSGGEAGLGICFEVAYARTREALSTFVHDLVSHPSVPIEPLRGASGAARAYGARLAGQPSDMLSVSELNAAFAFEVRDAVLPRSPTSVAVRLFAVLVLVALAIYLLLRFMASMEAGG